MKKKKLCLLFKNKEINEVETFLCLMQANGNN